MRSSKVELVKAACSCAGVGCWNGIAAAPTLESDEDVGNGLKLDVLPVGLTNVLGAVLDDAVGCPVLNDLESIAGAPAVDGIGGCALATCEGEGPARTGAVCERVGGVILPPGVVAFGGPSFSATLAVRGRKR